MFEAVEEEVLIIVLLNFNVHTDQISSLNHEVVLYLIEQQLVECLSYAIRPVEEESVEEATTQKLIDDDHSLLEIE